MKKYIVEIFTDEITENVTDITEECLGYNIICNDIIIGEESGIIGDEIFDKLLEAIKVIESDNCQINLFDIEDVITISFQGDVKVIPLNKLRKDLKNKTFRI